MARIVFAWEMGSGMGHVRYLSELAGRLQAAGHEIACIMREVHSADRELARHRIAVLPAPRLPRPKLKAEMTVNFAELLIVAGYCVEGALTSLIKSWRSLFDLLSPDLLIVNYSPTAQLAARNYPAQVVNLGTGFAVPPAVAPMPTLVPWIEMPEERLNASEEMVVQSINRALVDLAEPTIDHLYEIFQCDQNVLITFAELDHYPDRLNGQYRGPIISSAAGDDPKWPEVSASRSRIFCYLKSKHPWFGHILNSLNAVDAAKLIFAADIGSDQASDFSEGDWRFSPTPLDLEAACEKSDLVICHAGHGTVSNALLRGTPLLLIPEPRNLEQIINARNVSQMGAGIAVTPEEAGQDPKGWVHRAIEEILGNSKYAESAQSFARSHTDFDSDLQMSEITKLCSDLAGA